MHVAGTATPREVLGYVTLFQPRAIRLTPEEWHVYSTKEFWNAALL